MPEKQDGARATEAKEWENHKETITELYKTSTVDEVAASMASDYSFNRK